MGSLKSPYRYAGGKSKLLPQIMEYLELIVKDSSIYIEPFVGGGSVFLEVVNRYPDKTFYLNDKNKGVADFWSIVTGGNDKCLEELCKLIDQPPTVDLHAKLRKDKSLNPVMSAYKSLFFNVLQILIYEARENRGHY
ncbi:MAG: DNA adenine methylase [Spirochaetia bacterium]|nr:DNA adenine methylase [Spirochaetia bacterium]